jgi:hypothetical protein
LPVPIGTLNENPLHGALKRWCAEPGDRLEAPVDGFVVDILRGDRIIEVQTAGFSSIRRKLRQLVAEHRVHLVYPVAERRWIVKLPAGGGEPMRRRSPKRGSVLDLFSELVSFPDLLCEPNFSLEVLLTDQEEVRRPDRRRGWRRGGWVVVERRLLDVTGSECFGEANDLLRLVPDDLAEPFGTLELARALGQPRWLAQRAAYCLSRSRVIRQVGKTGNAHLYERERPRRRGRRSRGRTPRARASTLEAGR